MIVIKIQNANQIVASHKGRLAARFGSYFFDLERRVEEEIVRQLAEVFAERNIQAEIEIVKDKPGDSGAVYEAL